MHLLAQTYPMMLSLTTTSGIPSNHAVNDETQISHRDGGETPGFLSCKERKCIMSTQQEDNRLYTRRKSVPLTLGCWKFIQQNYRVKFSCPRYPICFIFLCQTEKTNKIRYLIKKKITSAKSKLVKFFCEEFQCWLLYHCFVRRNCGWLLLRKMEAENVHNISVLTFFFAVSTYVIFYHTLLNYSKQPCQLSLWFILQVKMNTILDFKKSYLKSYLA